MKVAIQGLGHVGYRLAQYLKNEGAELFVADIYEHQLARAKDELGAKIVSPQEILALDVDVIAPCALGAILNENTIPTLQCKLIAGAANNQLATEQDGESLRKRGILYAPDYVLNAGGVIDIYHQKDAKSSPDALKAHIEGIGDTLTQIYKRADEMSQPTNTISNVIAEERFKQ